MLSLFYMINATAQNREVSGVIKTGGDTPLSNALIKSISSNYQAESDVAGRFHIKVSEIDTLFITHVGFDPLQLRISPTTKLPLIITLKVQSNQLNEVIINTGYQSVPKERSTGAFSQISNAKFNEQISPDIISRLESIANSVSVSRKTSGNNSQIMVRGLSTIQGVKQPLIIVDNFPYEGDLTNLNPNEIQDISILKDAAAASVWGTKAGNGVIVITTKKARFNQDTALEFNSNVTIADKPDLFYLPQINSGDFIDVEKLLFSEKFRFSDTSNISRPPFSEVYEILFKLKSSLISQSQAEIQINALRDRDVRNDFMKYIYRKSVNQQYSFNIKGGSNNLSWLLFAGYDQNISDLNATYNRFNIRTQNTFKPFKNLQISIGALYTQTKSEAGRISFSDIATIKGNIPPYTQLADVQGKPVPVVKDFRKLFTDTLGGGRLLDWNYYPLSDHDHISNTIRISDILANVGLHYKILSWLELDIKYQFEKQQTVAHNLQGLESYKVRDLINTFTQLDKKLNSISYHVPKGDILDYSTRNLTSHNFRTQFVFNKSIGNIDVNAISGLELSEKLIEQDKNRAYGYNNEILTSGNVDYSNPYQNLIQGTHAFIPSILNFQKTLNRFVSTFANVSLTYLDKYTLSISGRRDASNLFGVNANNKWTPLWSTGFAWDLSKEGFYKSGNIPYLKFRVSYGFSGNINPDATAVTTIAYDITSPYTQTPTAVIDKYYNPDLKWEKVGILNLGLDFRTKNNRIGGSIEYYQKKATDLFGSIPVDYTTGLVNKTIIKNVASMKGRGIDLELNTINIDKTIKWVSNINASFYKDEVSKYYLNSYQGSNFINGGQLIAGLVGKPVYSVFSYKWAGLDPLSGDPQGYLNGQVSKDYLNIVGSGTTIDDLKYHGPAFPVLFGSIGNTVSYKYLSITVRLLYKLGYYFQKQSINYSSLVNNNVGHTDYGLRWKNSGDEKYTNVPSFIFPVNSSRDDFYSGSEALVDKADNVRLQYINISYDFRPKHFFIGIKNIQAQIVLNNLGIVWKETDAPVDPDYNFSVIPPAKSISLGLKASF